LTYRAPTPDLETFVRLARPGCVIPLYVEFPFDTETAVTAYAKLRRGSFGFLLESVIGGERWARYSMLGSEPREAWRLTGDRVERWLPEQGWTDGDRTEDPLASFSAWMGRHQPVPTPELPRFWGGAVGFFGYDMVRWFERLPAGPEGDMEAPDACFLLTDRVLIVDNLLNRAIAVIGLVVPDTDPGANPAAGAGTAGVSAAADVGAAADTGGGDAALEVLYRQGCERLEDWLARLDGPHGLAPISFDAAREVPLVGNRSAGDYQAAVARVRDYIAAGDAFQVVLSQRLETPMTASPLDTYRALRTLNPSPYLYFLDLDGVRLIGSSPEVLVRVEDRRVTVRPIAGTRPRGRSATEDAELERSLLADEKERAEHLMLVDLGRNDVARVAEPDSVQLVEFMTTERYSHVIHLVSEISARLRADVSALDAFRACFPAGTLSGAPKVRAMEIIDELEPTRRGPYGGAAGYVSFGLEALDMAIAIRTIVNIGTRAYVQAGAGVVHDSVPEREWAETWGKARALVRALEVAAGSGS